MPHLSSHPASNTGERQQALELNGPHLDLIIRNPALIHFQEADFDKRGLAPYVTCSALVDTGATAVVIDLRLAQSLGLRQTGIGNVIGVGGQQEAIKFAGQLEVPQMGYIEIIEMIALRKGEVSHPVLLGRSFLKNFVTTFDGPSGIMTIARPTTGYNPVPSEEDHAHI